MTKHCVRGTEKRRMINETAPPSINIASRFWRFRGSASASARLWPHLESKTVNVAWESDNWQLSASKDASSWVTSYWTASYFTERKDIWLRIPVSLPQNTKWRHATGLHSPTTLFAPQRRSRRVVPAWRHQKPCSGLQPCTCDTYSE